MKMNRRWLLACGMLGLVAGIGHASRAADRELQFPVDRAIGVVHVRPAIGGDYLHSTYKDWKTLGEAKGSVRVPEGSDVRLDVSKAASADLSVLDALKPDDVQVLNLRDTDVSDDGLKHVGRLSGLRIVSLQSTRVGDAGIAHLAGLAKLQEIDLGAFAVNQKGFGVGDEAMKVLAPLPELASVDLRLTKVTDQSLAELAKSKSLREIRVPGTKVSDAGLKLLEQMPKLELLSLGVYDEGANVTDAGLAHLAKLVRLKHLDLSGTKITNDGLPSLAKLSRLESLNLEHTEVTEAGLAHLEPLTSLESLRLYLAEHTTDVGAAHLAKLKSLRRLTDHLDITEKGVALMATLPHLEHLDLSGPSISVASTRHIAGMKSLKWLSFQNGPLNDEAMAPLAGLESLEYLTVYHTDVTGKGFATLRDLPKLRIVAVHFSDEASAKSDLKEIGKLTQINDLRIGGEGLNGASLQDIAGLAGLESLELDFPVDDAGALVVGSFPKLKSFRALRSALTDAGMKQLAGLANLEFLQINGQFTDQGLAQLASCPKLKILYVGAPQLTQQGVDALTKSLPALQTAVFVPQRGGSEISLSAKDGIRRQGGGEERATFDAMEDQLPPLVQLENWLNTPGGALTFDELRGKVVLIDFWGTWCGPCIATTPRLKAMHEKYRDAGLVILGVHTTRGADEMAAYIEKEKVAWPVAADVKQATAKAWKVPSYPSFYLIDRAGKVRMARPYRGDLERAVEMLMAEKAEGGK